MDTCPWLGSFPWCWHSYLGGCTGTPVWHFSNKPSRTDDPDQIEASLGSQPGPLAWKVSNLERQEKKESRWGKIVWVLLSDWVLVSLWQNIKQLNHKLWRRSNVQVFKVFFTVLRSLFLIKAKQLNIRNLMIMVLILLTKDMSQFLWCQCYIKKSNITVQYFKTLTNQSRWPQWQITTNCTCAHTYVYKSYM